MKRLAAALFGALVAAQALGAQTIGGCAIFPPGNIWNVRVDSLPVDPNSAAMVNTIGATKKAHADFGTVWNGAPNGIPFVVVPGTQPRVGLSFEYESDPGPYPIPPDAPIEGGAQSTGDRHVLVIDSTNCVLYETWSSYPQPDGSWKAGSGAIFDLKSNALRPAGWTSADAAGLPVFPGLVRYDEVAAGEIKHAIRFTVPDTRRAYVWPARHYASKLTDPNYPPMGQRFRLRAGFDTSGFSAQTRVILQALKTYGMILADNGSAWYLSGAPDARWDDNALAELGRLTGADFEAVDSSSLMVQPDSAQARVEVSAPKLASLSVSPVRICGGATASLTVALDSPAAADAARIALESSSPGAAQVPAELAVPAGATRASVAVATRPVSLSTAVTISASYADETKTALIEVWPAGVLCAPVPARNFGGSRQR